MANWEGSASSSLWFLLKWWPQKNKRPIARRIRNLARALQESQRTLRFSGISVSGEFSAVNYSRFCVERCWVGLMIGESCRPMSRWMHINEERNKSSIVSCAFVNEWHITFFFWSFLINWMHARMDIWYSGALEFDGWGDLWLCGLCQENHSVCPRGPISTGETHNSYESLSVTLKIVDFLSLDFVKTTSNDRSSVSKK